MNHTLSLGADATLPDPAPPGARAAAAAAAVVVVGGGGEARAAGARRCPTCEGEFPGEYVVCPRDATPLGDGPRGTDPMLGVVLGGTYRVTRALGAGAMGKLYEAEHVRLARPFAIKVLHEAFADKRDALVRFEREARAAARIRSDHVVDVVDVLTAPDGRPCIAAEKLEGEDLQARLDRIGKMPIAEAVALARHACRGLAAAHAHGVIHRDLKPSNLFLCARPDGRVTLKILDFGVAKLMDEGELTRAGAVVGTPAYMAPEQARGSSSVDARADVYAVGAVLYRMLTGHAPYSGSDPTATLARLLEGAPVRPRVLDPEIPEGVESVLQRAMSRDPSERPASALELEAELATFDTAGAVAADTAARTWRRDGVEPSEAQGTLVLTAGSVAQADAVTKSARRARPVAAALVAAATVAGAGATAILGQAWGHGARDPALVHALVVVLSAIGGATVFGVMFARLRARWHSAPEVRELVRRWRAPLAAALLTYGALDLTTRAAAAWSAAPSPSPDAPWRILAALLATLTTATLLRISGTPTKTP